MVSMKQTGKSSKRPFGSRSGGAGKGFSGGGKPPRDGRSDGRGKGEGRSGSRSGAKPQGKSGPRKTDWTADRVDTRRDPGYSELRDTRAPRTTSRKPGRQDGARRRDTDTTERSRANARSSKPASQSYGKKQFSPAPEAEPAPRAAKSARTSIGPRPNLFGLHAVREAWLNPKRSIHAIYLTDQTAAAFESVMAHADKKGLERPDPKVVSKDDLDRVLGRDTVHQGVALSAAPQEEAFVQDIISIGADQDRSVVLMLDQVTDPHNVGAILRSASAFGAHGVIMQKRHAPELEGVLAKTACGATEHLTVAYETNLARTLDLLSEAGYVVIGLDEHAEDTLSSIEIPAKAVLVLGNEGDGMRRLIREHCDVLVTLPTQKPINSLNVSNAAAVALYALVAG